MVNFTSVSSANFCNEQKCSTNGCDSEKSILSTIFKVFGRTLWCLNCTENFSASTSFTPSSAAKKSKCQKVRRNSPSLTACKPTAFWCSTSLAISLSSTWVKSAQEISPQEHCWRACFNVSGRKKLQTISKRNGAEIRGCALGKSWDIKNPLLLFKSVIRIVTNFHFIQVENFFSLL